MSNHDYVIGNSGLEVSQTYLYKCRYESNPTQDNSPYAEIERKKRVLEANGLRKHVIKCAINHRKRKRKNK